MSKTIKIDLGGTLFNIDEEAFSKLRRYLNEIDLRLKNMPGGAETIEDIEIRIAEIFQAGKGLSGIITNDDVDKMISQLGKPEDFYNDDDGTIKSPGPGTTGGRLTRSVHDSIMAGICGGLGKYLRVQSVWIRLLFIILSFFFGAGIILYAALWIALPRSETGSSNLLYREYGRNAGNASRVGNVLNESLKALGKTGFIIFRIIFGIMGLSILLTGFLLLLTFIAIFIFGYPGTYLPGTPGFDLSAMPDFLNYIVNPAIVPWIRILLSAVIIIPLLLLIYLGIRLIFWFRVRDGIFLLSGFILWVGCVAFLSIILFNEGVSFNSRSDFKAEEMVAGSPDTLYIVPGKTIAGLSWDKKFAVPNEHYEVLVSEKDDRIYIKPWVYIDGTESKSVGVEIHRSAAGRDRSEARSKAGMMDYGYSVNGDTLKIDEYYSLPAGSRWSFNDIHVQVHAPEGTVIFIDEELVNQDLFRYHRIWEPEDGGSYLVIRNGQAEITEEGIIRR